MKYARVVGSTVNYYAKPPATKHKRHRDPIKVGERTCKNRVCAWFRKWVYETI